MRVFLLRVLLYSPKDMVAGLLAFAATSAIIANALFLQTGPHPAPMFGSVVMIPQASSTAASLLPQPRPADADALLSESRLAETRISEPRFVEPRPVESKPAEFRTAEPKTAEPKAADALTNLVKATGAGTTASLNVVRPPAPIPLGSGPTIGSRRVAAVQRALTEYGSRTRRWNRLPRRLPRGFSDAKDLHSSDEIIRSLHLESLRICAQPMRPPNPIATSPRFGSADELAHSYLTDLR